MKKEITFTDGTEDYYASVWIWEDGEYDVTECYFINELCESVDVSWKDFRFEIEKEIEEYLPVEVDGYYGGYDNYLVGLAKSYY